MVGVGGSNSRCSISPWRVVSTSRSSLCTDTPLVWRTCSYLLIVAPLLASHSSGQHSQHTRLPPAILAVEAIKYFGGRVTELDSSPLGSRLCLSCGASWTSIQGIDSSCSSCIQRGLKEELSFLQLG